MQIVLFGQLAEIAGAGILSLSDITSTEQLVDAVNNEFPSMGRIKYIVAVNKKVVTANTLLNETTQVALLPPFSGG